MFTKYFKIIIILKKNSISLFVKDYKENYEIKTEKTGLNNKFDKI